MQADEDAKALIAAEHEETVARAALNASARQHVDEWQVEGISQQISRIVCASAPSVGFVPALLSNTDRVEE